MKIYSRKIVGSQITCKLMHISRIMKKWKTSFPRTDKYRFPNHRKNKSSFTLHAKQKCPFARHGKSKGNPHPTYQNLILRKNFTVPFLKYKRLKLKLRVLLAGHSVAMVTYCVTKLTPTCSLVIGQFFDTMIVGSIDKEW